jgi:hypothetical protein
MNSKKQKKQFALLKNLSNTYVCEISENGLILLLFEIFFLVIIDWLLATGFF